MPLINNIMEISIYVYNLDEAEAFYKNLFDLKPYSRSGQRHVFFRIGDTMLLLFDPAESRKGGSVPGHGAEGPSHVAFRIGHGDLDFWRKRLISMNIEIEQEYNWSSGGRSIYFRDPSGNSVELVTPDTWEASI
jgi:catechol 2,3-dioxygenase-like lactoylglutathione lyase family enzyme